MKPRVVISAYQVLRGRDMTLWDVCHEVHCHYVTAKGALRELHSAGLVHIVGWKRRQRQPEAIYSFGHGQDAPMPEPMSANERLVAWRAKMSVEDRDFLAARRRQRRRKVVIDPLTAAFFGKS